MKKFICSHQVREDADRLLLPSEIKTIDLEFQASSKLFSAQHERLSALDELNMSIITMTLRNPHENSNDAECHFKILPVEVLSYVLQFTNDAAISENEIKKQRGQMQYLNTLSTTSSSLASEECPICLKTMGPQRIVLSCAHNFWYVLYCIEVYFYSL